MVVEPTSVNESLEAFSVQDEGTYDGDVSHIAKGIRTYRV